MTFNLLSLKNTFAAADQQYIADFNTNFGNITTMFTDSRADIDSLANLQGQKIVDDVLRKIEASDKSGGALGPYSFVINLAETNKIKLVHENADGYSYGYIGTDRFSTNATLEYDMSSQITGTYYVGITGDSSTGDVTIQVNATEGQVPLPLYSVEYDASADTLTNPKRVDRTVLFSNTLLQSILETPQSLSISSRGTAYSVQDTDLVLSKFKIPHAHRIVSIDIIFGQIDPNWTGDVRLRNLASVGSISANTAIIDHVIPTSTTNTEFTECAVETAYSKLSFPAGTTYEISIDGSGTSNGVAASSAECVLNYIPTYNLPVTN